MAKNYPGNARNKSIWQTFTDQYPFLSGQYIQSYTSQVLNINIGRKELTKPIWADKAD